MAPDIGRVLQGQRERMTRLLEMVEAGKFSVGHGLRPTDVAIEEHLSTIKRAIDKPEDVFGGSNA